MIEYENLSKVNEPFRDEFQTAFNALLKKGKFILDEQTAHFEEEFAAFVGARYCIGVSSGFDALILALKVFDFPAGKEIIVPSNTCIVTILAILHNDLIPVLVEPNPRTYNLDVQKLEDKITAQTVAILPVHLYGKLCPMASIMSLAKERNLKVIEDCAQALGANFLGKKAGSFGDVSAFSFYPTKNLGALGDGGAITTDDPLLFEKTRILRNYGCRDKNDHELLGFSNRLDEMQAAFLRIKLRHLDNINGHKAELAALYLQHLSPEFIKPIRETGYEDVWHIFPIRYAARDKLRDYLKKRGVKTLIHYPTPPHRQKILIERFKNETFPISDEIHRTILSLPCSFMHSKNEILEVIQLLNHFICPE